MAIEPRFLGASTYDSAVLSRHVASADEIDELGHVNNAVYVKWVQDAAVAHWLSVAGGDLATRYVWICLRHEIDYRAEILEGDQIEIRTWLGRGAGPRFDRHTDIRRAGSTKWSAQGLTTWVLLDAGTRRPVRVGQDILEAFGLKAEDHFAKAP